MTEKGVDIKPERNSNKKRTFRLDEEFPSPLLGQPPRNWRVTPYSNACYERHLRHAIKLGIMRFTVNIRAARAISTIDNIITE